MHVEGTAPPDLIRRLAERNGMAVPEGVLAAPDRFAYTDFLDFLRTYDLAASVIRTGDDYRDVTYEYLAGCAREGALYVELTASPDHAALVGLGDEEHLDGIGRGIDDARRALAGACLFGFSSAVAQRLPAFSESLAVLFQALPYVLVLIVVAGLIGRARPPASIGVPYVKE